MPQLLGFIPQRFRVYRGLPAAQYARFLPLLEKRINSEVIARLRKIDLGLLPPTGEALKIGEVKDFGSPFDCLARRRRAYSLRRPRRHTRSKERSQGCLYDTRAGDNETDGVTCVRRSEI